MTKSHFSTSPLLSFIISHPDLPAVLWNVSFRNLSLRYYRQITDNSNKLVSNFYFNLLQYCNKTNKTEWWRGHIFHALITKRRLSCGKEKPVVVLMWTELMLFITRAAFTQAAQFSFFSSTKLVFRPIRPALKMIWLVKKSLWKCSFGGWMRSRERLNSSLLTADHRSVIYLWSLKELV